MTITAVPATGLQLRTLVKKDGTLVALMGANKVAEIDREGKEVWAKDNMSNPYDCQRLDNGNTLIADNNGVFEVDPTGQIVWQVQQPGATQPQVFRFS